MQLADDDPLGAIDNKRSLGCHQGQFAHEHLSLPCRPCSPPGAKKVTCNGAPYVIPSRKHSSQSSFGIADFIAIVRRQHRLPIVALDRKHLVEHGLQADVLLAPLRTELRLQKYLVRIDLDLDQIRRRDDLFDPSEINSFCYTRWHFYLYGA